VFPKAIAGRLESQGFGLSAGRIIETPSSTKNKERAWDSEMHSAKKGRRRCFGMNLRIGVEEEKGRTHSLDTTPADRSDVEMAGAFPPGGEGRISVDAGRQGRASARRTGASN